MRAALAVLAAATLWLLITPLYRMGLWLEQPNEGWNATHALNAFSGGLYPPPGSFIINNYPPLWFYLTGGLARLGADPIFAGRVIAFLSFIATAVAIFAILRRLKASVSAAIAGALCFVLILAGLLASYIGLSEPQMLAHALVAFGAAVLVRADNARTAALAAVLTVIGLFTKHVVIALPLASLAWLLIYRRHLLLPWLVAGAVSGFASLGAWLALHANVMSNMLFPRVFALPTFGKNLALITKALVPLAIYGAVAWRRRAVRDEAMMFAALAIAAGLLALLIFGGAQGVSINVVFDLIIAASIGLGLAWDRIEALSAQANGWRVAIIAVLLIRVGSGVPYANVALAFDARERARLQEQSSVLVALRDRLKQVKGPVACEALSACIWAGHRNEVDLWKLHFETTLGPFMDTRVVLQGITEGHFGAVVLFGRSNPVLDRQLPGLATALTAGYAAPEVLGGVVSLFPPKKSR
ncbi:MAG: hypothetical protein A4S14_06360 [Proteobacteria bacterium SG_bin9]|nr:MAG: hypothetical protein A4S14_06360 [Proteobacteria bacterium SG_bin9]